MNIESFILKIMIILKLVLFEIIKNMEKSNFRLYIKTHFELGD